MNQNHDSFLQQDVSFSSSQDTPPPGVNIEEHFWQKAVGLHPKRNRWPYDATLLFGLIVALVVLICTLINLDPDSDQSFMYIINRGFPWALGFSGLFMSIGLIQRYLLNNNENKIEKTYQNLLRDYTKNQREAAITSSDNYEQERLIETLDSHFLDLTESINANFSHLSTTINNFSKEMADYSGKEIERTLHEFSKSILGLPEQLSLALERKLEEPQQERIDFRQAVSGLLSLPVDLSELNKTLIANSNQLAESTKSSSAAIEHIASLSDRFSDTTKDFSETTKVLNGAVENSGELLSSLENATESLEASRKEMSTDMRQTINEMGSNVGQAIEKSTDMNNDAATKFASSVESFQMNIENISHQIRSENKTQSEFLTKAIQDSFEKLKVEAKSLRGSQIQMGQMIDKALSGSAKNTNEATEKLSASVRAQQTYLDNLAKQLSIENKREAGSISSAAEKMDQIQSSLRELLTTVKHQTPRNEYGKDAPGSTLPDTELLQTPEEEKPKPKSSLWPFRR